jgi:hypothetical protein
MPDRIRCSVFAVSVCSLILSTGAAAQLRVEVGATVGYYSPMGSFRPATAHSTNLPSAPSDLSGAEYAAQLRLWISRVGVEIAGATSASVVGGGITPEGETPTTKARLSTGTAQLLYRVTSSESRMRVWVGAGGGVIRHGGHTYEPFGSPVNGGGVVSIGSAFRIRRGLSAEAGVTTIIYDLNIHGVESGVDLSERGREVDASFRTGLSYGWP